MQTFHQASGSEPLHLLQAHTVLCHFPQGGKVRTVSKVRVASKTGNTESDVGERKVLSVLNYDIIISV